jgi:pimeloyl-ACP methyl ester carboxylesterase
MARRRAVAVAAPSRVPTGLIIRILLIVVILAAVAAVVLSAAGGFLTYRIIAESNTVENVTPDSFLLSNYESLNFTDKRGEEHAGWLLRGNRGSPVIILSHGYDSNRSEMLSLGTVLQENHFNVYLFNYRGEKPKSLTSDMGARESAILEDAVEKLLKQPGINTSRVGMFGKNIGAYASMRVAEQNPAIQAIVVDNVYDKPIDMFNSEIHQTIGTTAIFRVVMDAEFRLVNIGSKSTALSADFSKLDPVPKYFISGRDVPSLATSTEAFYDRASQPKRLLVIDHTQFALMNGTEKREYEDQIRAFFQQHLPLRAD